MSVNFLGARRGDMISIASFGTQRKEAQATFTATVNLLTEESNRLLLDIWSVEEKIEEVTDQLESARAKASQSPDDLGLWDSTRTLEKKRADLERELRSIKRRNELQMDDIKNKIALEDAKYQTELARIDEQSDQYLGDQDPDAVDALDAEASKYHGDRRGSTGSRKSISRIQSPTPPTEKKGDELSIKMLDLLSMQMKILSQQQSGNNNEKFYARQTTGKDLPTFSGDCSEWPAFHAQFKQTTTACGFKPVENLYRLQKALKGKAKSSVQALLTTPENVDVIMKILEEQFGQPRYIIQTLLKKVRETQSPRDGRPETLITFANNVKNMVVTVENLERSEYLMNPTLLEELVHKLDNHYRLRWGEFVVDKDLVLPTIKNFSSWLDKISRSAQVVAPVPEMKEEKKNHVFFAAAGGEKKNQSKCLFCGKPNHWVQDCRKLQQMSIADRLKWVTETNRCYSCLRTNHMVENCRSKKECGIDGCASFHHRLLHTKKKQETEKIKKEENQDEAQDPNVIFCTSCAHEDSDVLLKLVDVVLVGPTGKMNVWALCDEGATCSLLEADVAKQLGIFGKKEELVLKWTNDLKETHSSSEIVNFKIKGETGRDVFTLNRVRTIEDLRLPQQSMNMDKLKNRFKYLKGVPVKCQQAIRPVLLIGEDNIQLTIAREVKEPKFEIGPVASRTKLGWTVHGPLSTHSRITSNFSFVISTPSLDQELHQLVKESFKLESFGLSKFRPPKSEAEKRAEELLKSTSRKCEDNRWETGLLWKEDNVQFPSSMKMALSRLESVERNMEKDQSLREWYNEKINYYVESGYCREVEKDELKVNSPGTFYLPHFAASNPNKPNKRRLVFDAAAKVCGASLNDKLMIGPDLLNSLPGVLMRFRRWKVGFGADVKEMFHQIKIKKEDQSAQRFLWRGGDRGREPKIMAMTSMIFGAASSPCSAQYVMRRNADDRKGQFPEAVQSIKENMYMDDLADGANTIEESKNRIAEINKIQDEGGFPMLKWTCSSPEALVEIPDERKAEPASSVEVKPDSSIERILGMYWKPNEDHLTFKFTFPKVNPAVVEGTQVPTKRDVLRLAMSLFDPLGVLAFYTIEARILLQDIWRSELDWDEKLHGKLLDKWNLWRKLLSQVNNVKIGRCYSPFIPEAERIRLHIFCDAGEKAYSSVAYLEVTHKSGKDINFVYGKARVSPVKPLSIPRLELLGAVMAVRIGAMIKEEIKLKVDSCVYWTDSRNVLCWIRSDARKYKQFVGCKIGEILETSEVSEWRWVPTAMNPADEGTRDTTVELNSSNIWITGPPFLHQEEEFYPVEKIKTHPTDEELEVKGNHVLVLEINNPVVNLQRFSHYNKLIRSFAWVRRYIWILKIKASKQNHTLPKFLLPVEWKSAEMHLFKIIQQQEYKEEIRQLKSGNAIPNKSSLLKLSPFLDKEGILRVESRAAEAPVSIDKKFPIILPGSNHMVKLILKQKHQEFGHGNKEGVINSIRSRFWVTDVRKHLKKMSSECMYCRAEIAVPKPPRMGNLPESRFAVNLPCFHNCGLDVFGPIVITEGRRQAKRYVVLFTCLTTRAVHLEKISSLDVDAMMMAIRRFIAMRNKPECFFSDNGTNMVGANKEIKESMKDVDIGNLETSIANIGIHWKFIPPASPHFGGSWERLIRCVKGSLYAALKSMHTRHPREEVLETLLREAENIVNSRPLTEVPTEPGADAITPNHFLKINMSKLSTFGTFTDDDFSLRKQWRISQRLIDHFWTRWLSEYLPTLHERKKWNKEETPVKVGDFVYVADVNGIRGEWTKAVIVKVYPGKDGRIRVVDVRTSSGRIVKRPVLKCAVVNLEPGTGN